MHGAAAFQCLNAIAGNTRLQACRAQRSAGEFQCAQSAEETATGAARNGGAILHVIEAAGLGLVLQSLRQDRGQRDGERGERLDPNRFCARVAPAGFAFDYLRPDRRMTTATEDTLTVHGKQARYLVQMTRVSQMRSCKERF